MSKTLFSILFLCYFTHTFATNPRDTLEAHKLYEHAALLSAEYKSNEALDVINQAIKLMENELGKQHSALSNYYKLKSTCLIRLMKYKELLEHNKYSLKYYKRIGLDDRAILAHTYFNLGIASLETKAFEASQVYFERAAEIYSQDSARFKSDIVGCIAELGILNRRVKKYDQALSYYVSAIDGNREIGDTLGLAKTHYNTGNLYYETDEIAKARFHYKRSLEFYKKLHSRNSIGLGMAYDAIARTYKLQHAYDLSEHNFKLAYDYLKQSFGPDHRYTVGNLERLADIYGLAGKRQDALDLLHSLEEMPTHTSRTYRLLSKNYVADGNVERGEYYAKKAIQASRRNSDDDLLKVNLSLSLALPYIESDQLRKAKRVLDEAEELCLNKFETPPKQFNYIFLNRARILARENRFHEAISMIDSLLATSKDVYRFLDNGMRINNRLWDDLFRAKCKISFAQFDHYPNEENWSKAIRNANEYLTGIDSMRQQTMLLGSKSNLAGRPNIIVQEVLRLLEYKFNQVADPELIRDAMWANDMVRDLLWVDFYLSRDVTGLSQEDIKNLNTAYNLRKEIVNMTLNTAMNADSLEIKEKIIELKEQLIVSDTDSNRLINPINLIDRGLKNNLIDDIRKISDICINYFTSNDNLFRITVEPDTSYIQNINWDAEDDLVLQSFLNAITSGKGEWLEQSQHLGAKLLHGIQMHERTQRMLVLADGFLHSVPFDILSVKNQDSSRLLIEGFEIFHSPSLKALFIEYPDVESRGIVTFAPDYSTKPLGNEDVNSNLVWNDLVRNNSLNLPGALKEAREIKDMLSGDLFEGEKATAAKFNEVAGRYNVLHLAMHAVCEFESPIFSRLIFQREGEDENSRFCYASQIANMNIPADMVVLSACNTGSGQFIPGEGISSIARSFQYAGAKSSVYSLWKVPDISTPELMKYFYQNLKEGLDKPAAMRSAKLKFIAETAESAKIHPMYWAGFVVNGLPDPIELPGMNSYFYIILGLAVGILSILLYYLVFRRSKT